MAEDIFIHSNIAMTNDDNFRDLFLKDMVQARYHVARKKLEYLGPSPLLRGMLRRGTQVTMDPEDRDNMLLEMAVGFLAAMGTCLYEGMENLQTFVRALVFFVFASINQLPYRLRVKRNIFLIKRRSYKLRLSLLRNRPSTCWSSSRSLSKYRVGWRRCFFA